MTFKEFKENFRKNVVSVGYMAFTIVLAVVVLLGCGIFFLVFALSDNVAEQAAKVVFFVISGFSFVGALLFALLSPWLIAVYPKYKKLTHCFFQKFVFTTYYQTEENVVQMPPSELIEWRVLTVERQKSVVGCLGKLKIGIQDDSGEIELQGVRYRLLGVLKNGEAKSFAVPATACRVCAFFDVVFAQRYSFAQRELPEGKQDISLTGKAHLDFMKGNSFIFE